ncbi:hypothetical protein HA402_003727 [Bradysia odoriphaga]|nr:hypothetical protein HA402_003727 [Bradysia odoriphaga]
MEQIPEISTPTSASEKSCELQGSDPSITSNAIAAHQNLTVKFQLNDFHTVAQVYSNQLSIEAVKKDVGEKFKVSPDFLSIRQGSFRVPNSWRLFEVESNRFGIVEFQLSLNRLAKEFNDNVERPNERIHLDADVYYSHYHLPDFFSVYIPGDDTEEGYSKRVIVEIISKPIVKPYIGGFKTKTKEYHDAFTQTGPVFEAIKWSGITSRDCQAGQRNQSLMTKSDEGTQMFGKATETVFVENRNDVLLTPRKFESVDELLENKLNKVKVIQRNARRYLLKKFVKKYAAEWRDRCRRQPEIDKTRSENILDRFRRECIVNTFPKTREDFNLIYTQIQRWKEAEIKRINQLYEGGHRIAELHVLLDKEIQLFNGIERQRTKLRNHILEVQTEKMLEQLGTPTKWVGYKDLIIEMDSISHQKIRKLTDFYKKMKIPMKKVKRMEYIDELLGVLQNETQCSELIDMLKRERNILATNVDVESLESLRARQLALLIQFMQSKKFKLDEGVDRKMCRKCKMVKTIDDFQLYVRQNELDICKACNMMKKVSSIDDSIYRSILRAIRRDEQLRCAKSSYAFIIQEEDVREIIENIWHGHSILSQCDVRKQLRLPRWDVAKEWSPWNCILLTDDEARAHARITDLRSIYGEALMKNIRNKHHIGMVNFSKLRDMN